MESMKIPCAQPRHLMGKECITSRRSSPFIAPLLRSSLTRHDDSANRGPGAGAGDSEAKGCLELSPLVQVAGARAGGGGGEPRAAPEAAPAPGPRFAESS